MPDLAIVLFSSDSDADGRLEKAAGPLWSEFGSQRKRVIYVTTEGAAYKPSEKWTLAIVWEPFPPERANLYDDSLGAEAEIVQGIKSRVTKLTDDSVFVVLHHRGSSRLHETQRSLVMRAAGIRSFAWWSGEYSHDKNNDRIYNATADLLRSAGKGQTAYVRSRLALLAAVCRLDELAIDILMAFLAADLQWQMAIPDSCTEAAKLLPKQNEIESIYDRLKRRVAVSEALANKDLSGIESGLKALFVKLQQEEPDPSGFHDAYSQLRDSLFSLVQAEEQALKVSDR